MDTSVNRARVGLASAKTRHGLTEAQLRELQPGERVYVDAFMAPTRPFRHTGRKPVAQMQLGREGWAQRLWLAGPPLRVLRPREVVGRG